MNNSPSFISQLLTKTTDLLRWSVSGIVKNTGKALKNLLYNAPSVPAP